MMKIYKTLILLLTFVGITRFSYAQDVIVKTDNSTIVAKIIEVGTNEIQYKKWTNLEGPIYAISIKDITQINYQNGDVDKFTTDEGASANIQPKNMRKRSRVQFSLNAGVSIPLGKFGTTSDTKWSVPMMLNDVSSSVGYGAASCGLAAGLKLHIPVYKDKDRNNIVGIVIQEHLLYNSLSRKEYNKFNKYLSDMADEMNEYYGTLAYDYDIGSMPSYLNLSLMSGLDYTHYFTDALALFGELSWGLNLGSLGEINISNKYGHTYLYSEGDYNYYSTDGMIIDYPPYINLVYEIGCGVFLINRLSLGFYYMGFTPYTVTSTMESYDGNNTSSYRGDTLRIQSFNIKLGVHF